MDSALFVQLNQALAALWNLDDFADNLVKIFDLNLDGLSHDLYLSYHSYKNALQSDF